MFTDNKHLA
jgi:chromosome segregation ATPase